MSYSLRTLCGLLTAAFLLFSCGENSTQEQKGWKGLTTADIHSLQAALDEVIIRDGFNPPQASRIYALCHASLYGALPLNSGMKPLHQVLKGFPEPPAVTDTAAAQLAAVYCFKATALQLVYEDSLFEKSFTAWMSGLTSLNEEQKKAAMERANVFHEEIKKWIKADRFGEIRGMPVYSLKGPLYWKPTAPDYMDAAEPHWKHLRTWLLDSASQFRPSAHLVYSGKPEGEFKKQCDTLFNTAKNLTEEQKKIAHYWDDNPMVRIHDGHVTSSEKKLTPPGHWLGITRQAARKHLTGAAETSRLYCMVTFAMADAMIACWEAKYAHHTIRPISVFEEHYERNWTPELLTPSFPEYPSGHSTVSGAAAGMLTAAISEGSAFTDSTEVPFGYGVRSFASFQAAAKEASDSRFYGGIHFTRALDDGLTLGANIAALHLSRWNP